MQINLSTLDLDLRTVKRLPYWTSISMFCSKKACCSRQKGHAGRCNRERRNQFLLNSFVFEKRATEQLSNDMNEQTCLGQATLAAQEL